MSAAHRRELARQAVEQKQCGQRQACRFFELNRSTYRYEAKYPSLHVLEREQVIVDLSQEHPEMGADKIARLVRKRGYRVSNGRVREVRREEGPVVPPPKKKKRRRGRSTGRLPQQASYRGHVWSWDFIHDWTVKGGAFRVLGVVEEYTREVHALHVDRNIGSKKVQKVMEQLVRRHGAPAYIRSDNGPEFIATQLREWLAEEDGAAEEVVDRGLLPGRLPDARRLLRRCLLARGLLLRWRAARCVALVEPPHPEPRSVFRRGRARLPALHRQGRDPRRVHW